MILNAPSANLNHIGTEGVTLVVIRSIFYIGVKSSTGIQPTQSVLITTPRRESEPKEQHYVNYLSI